MKNILLKCREIVVFGIVAMLFWQCNKSETAFYSSTGSVSQNLFALSSKGPSPQKFRKNADNFISFESINGFRYSFAKGSFSVNGELVLGDVDIEVTEYVTKADMIFSGVTTMAGNNVLISGGMFNIKVSKSGQPVELRERYQVAIPAAVYDSGMEIFRGEEITNADSSNGVNWIQQEGERVNWDTTSFHDSGRYILELRFLSWCNLDKYRNAPTGTQVRLKLPEECTSSNTKVYMIFDERSVVNLFSDPNLEEFNSGDFNLPEGWDIKLL